MRQILLRKLFENFLQNLNSVVRVKINKFGGRERFGKLRVSPIKFWFIFSAICKLNFANYYFFIKLIFINIFNTKKANYQKLREISVKGIYHQNVPKTQCCLLYFTPIFKILLVLKTPF